MNLTATPDHILKASTDPEAKAELIKRGLAWDPKAGTKRTFVRKSYADEKPRKHWR